MHLLSFRRRIVSAGLLLMVIDRIFENCYSNGMLTINHAAGKEEGILSEDITYEELCRRFEYIAWPAGLGTLEENPTLWRVRDEPDDFYE